ncbi:MAG: ATP synthase subunit C [Methylobacter sp.]|nr:ATP synthase subunit C [Methylobacter sp.]MDP2097111.1 ATP synthase subunit C [Methylobacter sp.]MDP2427391.1 ATP synthase subunit C [Methylobacter sp.]MDP3053708.1 ATP synthase subunit C [Methylobacter sp.]MDP3362922.1 ATP synthase subunit C [Methylobacter sp.]
MEPLILALGWVGLYAPLALGAVGSMIGCSRAGSAACGALLEVESGYGRYIGVAAMPSSQTIYGIVVTMALRRELSVENSPGIFGLGLLAGLALLFSASAQGSACAASINVSKNKLEIFGISLAPAALVEGFAVFAFVFALVLAAGIPK